MAAMKPLHQIILTLVLVGVFQLIGWSTFGDLPDEAPSRQMIGGAAEASRWSQKARENPTPKVVYGGAESGRRMGSASMGIAAGDNSEECRAAWAAGDAPIFRGDSDFAPRLDFDGDGVICERKPG